MWPRNPQPLFIRTAEYLGEAQIEIRKKKYHQDTTDRPGNRSMKNNLTSGSVRLDQEPAANVIGRKRPERLKKTMANTSRYIRTDRRWEI
jgi:hypothetical protein